MKISKELSTTLNQQEEVEDLAKTLKRVSIENVERLKKREINFRRMIVELNKEISMLKQNKQHEQNEVELKETITVLRYENKFLTSKLKESKNSAVSDILEESFKDFGQRIEKSLTNAINVISKKNDVVENKIQEAIEANNAYANAVKIGSTQDDDWTTSPPEKTFQKIIRKVKNVELTDENLRQHHVNNLILPGVGEQRLGTEGKDKIADIVFNRSN